MRQFEWRGPDELRRRIGQDIACTIVKQEREATP